MTENKQHGSNPLKKLYAAFSELQFRTKVIILAVLVVTFSVFFPIISNIVGKSFGNAVGTAVGSLQAVTDDMPRGYKQGKEDGLSATDTQVLIRDRLQEIGKLDVLAAKAKLHDVNKVGDRYSALYEFGADILFSVDLSKANILKGDNQIEIRLPKPVVEVNVDSTRTKLLAERQRGWLNGTTEDGLTSYLNTVSQIQNKAAESLDNYEWLEQRAEQATMDQVSLIAGYITEKGTKVEILFEETAGDKQ